MKKNIVILGAGFGGLRAAIQIEKGLAKNKLSEHYKVILVDRHSYHTYTPLLYEVATTSEETANFLELKSIVAHSISEIFRSKQIEFIEDTVVHIDLPEQLVHLKETKINFDYLVLALGGETNFYGIPGIEEYSYPLKGFNEAIAIRNMISTQIDGKQKMKIVICGAGSTGVELAGEIKEWLPELNEECRSQCVFEVKLVQGGETILPGLDTKVIEKSKKRLEDLGVQIMTNSIVEKADEKNVYIKDNEKIDYDILIWAGGIKATDIATKMPLRLEKNGHIEISENMACVPNNSSLTIQNHIYALGDVTCLINHETGRPAPSVARVAIDEADIVAHNLIQTLLTEIGKIGKPKFKTYKITEYPYMIPLGGKYVIAKFGKIIISGYLGWILKGLVELRYLFGIFGTFRAIRIWLRGLRIFIQNDRLG